MNTPLHTTPAWLWDGKRQLPGRLELSEYRLEFHFDNFRDSHLNLIIPLREIEKVEEFLLFELSRNGMRVENRLGKTDVFVLEEPKIFKKLIIDQEEKIR